MNRFCHHIWSFDACRQRAFWKLWRRLARTAQVASHRFHLLDRSLNYLFIVVTFIENYRHLFSYQLLWREFFYMSSVGTPHFDRMEVLTVQLYKYSCNYRCNIHKSEKKLVNSNLFLLLGKSSLQANSLGARPRENCGLERGQDWVPIHRRHNDAASPRRFVQPFINLT